jgi:Flp pilus assembly protein TadB
MKGERIFLIPITAGVATMFVVPWWHVVAAVAACCIPALVAFALECRLTRKASEQDENKDRAR